MPLRSGFNLNEHGDNDKWRNKWEKLSKSDKEFYSNTLPFLLLCEDVGHISEKTIPIIIKRHKYNPIMKNDKILTEEYLSKFIGFEANVMTKTDKEFFDKLLRSYRMAVGGELKNKKAVEQETIEYVKKVFDEDLLL